MTSHSTFTNAAINAAAKSFCSDALPEFGVCHGPRCVCWRAMRDAAESALTAAADAGEKVPA